MPLTNILAERLLRHPVIWRKLCFGNDSDAGRIFTEHILTVVGSLGLQNRDPFAYLTDLLAARSTDQPLPSVVPGLAGDDLTKAAPTSILVLRDLADHRRAECRRSQLPIVR